MPEHYEIEEVISEGEKRFELYRRTISLFLGPVVFFIILFTPLPFLSAEAHRLSAVLGLVLIYWVGEAIPIPATAILGSILCVLLGVAKSTTVFAPFAHPIIFLFIGSFMLAEAMKAHKLDYRIALTILSIPWIGNSYYRVFFAIAVIPTFISMWISDSATTAMMYPIALGILSAVNQLSKVGRSRFNVGFLLTIAYSALIGGIGTPIGTPPNLIGIGMIDKIIGVKIPFFLWMVMAFPIMIVMLILMLLYMFLIHKPPAKEINGLSRFIAQKKSEMGGWNRGQKNTLTAFITAIILWTLPGIIAAIAGTDSEIYKLLDAHVHEEIVSLIAVLILFLTPVDWKNRKFTLTWNEAVKIDWGTIILFGGGLSLGGLMFSTKLADFMGNMLVRFTGVDTLWGITAAAIGLAIITTEVTSNTATANMLVPLMISVAQTAGVSGIPPAIGVCLGASMAFMLPVSTPSNAIVYGSGRVPITSMIRAGIILDIISFFVILTGLRILCPLLGLM
ncbi:MAG: DASS family sodium-coupled anion symporter [Nitrospinae bacterium]|nr:DASS family sodium-coupled anion symporter [Nitrospinota bacterium]